MWQKAFPFIVLLITLVLWLPYRLVKHKKKKYVKAMKEIVWIENIDKVDQETIRTAMVTIDKDLNTTSIREETYDYFVEEFSKDYVKFLNESSLAKKSKIKKLDDAQAKLTMKFDVPSLEKLVEAKNKLEGNVEL